MQQADSTSVTAGRLHPDHLYDSAKNRREGLPWQAFFLGEVVPLVIRIVFKGGKNLASQPGTHDPRAGADRMGLACGPMFFLSKIHKLSHSDRGWFLPALILLFNENQCKG